MDVGGRKFMVVDSKVRMYIVEWIYTQVSDPRDFQRLDGCVGKEMIMRELVWTLYQSPCVIVVILQTRLLQLKKCVFSQLWGLKVHSQGAGRVGFW